MSENEKLNNKTDDINIILLEDIFKSRNKGIIRNNNINTIPDNKLTNYLEYEEDNYDTWVYDKPISEDLINFNEHYDGTNLLSKSLDSIKDNLNFIKQKYINNKNITIEIDNNPIKI